MKDIRFFDLPKYSLYFWLVAFLLLSFFVFSGELDISIFSFGLYVNLGIIFLFTSIVAISLQFICNKIITRVLGWLGYTKIRRDHRFRLNDFAYDARYDFPESEKIIIGLNNKVRLYRRGPKEELKKVRSRETQYA